jgi:hypothetical protein
MVTLANYNLFLNSQVGVLQARIDFLDETIESTMSASAAKIKGGHFQERKALANIGNEKIQAMQKSLLENRAKISIIKPITYSVKNKMDIIRRIYERRVREAVAEVRK